MSSLFIVDCLERPTTASFWRKNKDQILSGFMDAETEMVDASCLGIQKIEKSVSQVIFVGTDSSFSLLVNAYFEELQKKSATTTLGFIAVGDSAIAIGLALPSHLKDLLTLLHSNCHQPLDLVRCHCLDRQKQPKSYVVVNDAKIRLPVSKLPFVLRGALQWLKNASGLMQPSSSNQITLCSKGEEMYRGEYLFSFIALGSHLIDGPEVMERRRYCQGKFRYFQLNNCSLLSLPANLTKSIQGEEVTGSSDVFSKHFDELELKAIGEDNLIVADGVEIGRLPATFTLLPKALRVISPLLSQPYKAGFAANSRVEVDVLKPIQKGVNPKNSK